MNRTRAEAIELCTLIESVCPQFGYHVALTGGTLYKEGSRKDADILFYRIRQEKNPNLDGLFSELLKHGIQKVSGFGWCHKATFKDKNIDFLFPEEPTGEYIPKEGGKHLPA